jgi:hypothetical protein
LDNSSILDLVNLGMGSIGSKYLSLLSF